MAEGVRFEPFLPSGDPGHKGVVGARDGPDEIRGELLKLGARSRCLQVRQNERLALHRSHFLREMRGADRGLKPAPQRFAIIL